MAHAPINSKLSFDKWVALAQHGKGWEYEELQTPFTRDGFVYASDNFRAHIAPADTANVSNAQLANGRLEQVIENLSKRLLDARKGVTVTFPAHLLREVSAVMGKESKDRCNILHVMLFADHAEFYRPGQDMEVRATVNMADGYTVSGDIPPDGMTIAINPGYLLDALAALPPAHSKGKRKGEYVDTVRISVASQHKPIAVDYGKLSAVIMPMNVN